LSDRLADSKLIRRTTPTPSRDFGYLGEAFMRGTEHLAVVSEIARFNRELPSAILASTAK
jgi:hypothetical protein